MCNKIKENLKIYPSLDKYKYELIVTEHISEEEMYSLHATCNCFVMPSYGEAWCIPAFEAMGFGNTPICSTVGGPSDYLKDGGGFLLPVREEPVFGMMETFNDIYTGYENWWSVDILAMQQKMRTVFEMWKSDREGYLKIQQQGRLSAEKYSYTNVGNMIKKALENAD
jgi:glycosyltransferase involved in cell wall biosynthesis